MAPPSILLGPPLLHKPWVHDENPSSQNLSPAQKPTISPTQEPTLPRNPCMDLFFCDHSLQNLPFRLRLESAWSHNPAMTLKIIFNFRNSNNEAFLPAILWLHQHHHLTLACNIGTFSNLGSLNDIPEILYRILEPSKGSGTMAGIKNSEKIQSIIQKKQREINRARLAWEKYIGDEKYRFLHNQISSFFADLLREDLQFLASRKFDKISMASKLCPSLDSACDKSTLTCEGIARKLFPCESDEEYKEIDESHYAYRVRDRLRKQVLVPLRKAIDASAERATIPTQKTAHENLFRFHQKVYESLLTGNNTKIKAFPHHIVARLNDESVGYDGVELQWRAMVKAWGKEQGWRNCLSIYNVPESIDGRDAAEDFALGMTLLITELSHEPWREKVLTFSTDPMFCRIEGGDLISKIEFIRKLKHDKNISFPRFCRDELQSLIVFD